MFTVGARDSTSGGSEFADLRIGIGVTDGTSSGCFGTASQSAVLTSLAKKKDSTSNLCTLLKGDTTDQAVAAISAMITDGIRLNWTTVNSGDGSVHAMMFAGDNVQAKVGSATNASSNQTINVGFQPDIVFILSDRGSNQNDLEVRGGYSLGVALRRGSLQRAYNWAQNNAVLGGVVTAREEDTDSSRNVLVAVVAGGVSIGSFTSTGFTASQVAGTGQSGYPFTYLAIKTDAALWLDWYLPASGGGTEDVQDPGFQPNGLMLLMSMINSGNQGANQSNAQAGCFGVFLADQSDNGSIYGRAKYDTSHSTDTGTVYRSGEVALQYDDDSLGDSYHGSFAGFHTAGYEIDWDVVDPVNGAQALWIGLAFQDMTEFKASGAATSSGSSTLKQNVNLRCGTVRSSSGGSSTLRVLQRIPSSGAASSSGSAVERLAQRIPCSGAAASTSTSSLTMTTRLTTVQARATSTATATERLDQRIPAEGDAASSGSAIERLEQRLVVHGRADSSASSTLNVEEDFQASTSAHSDGFSSLTTDPPIFSSTNCVSYGTSNLGIIERIPSTGSAHSSGFCTLTPAHAVPLLSVGESVSDGFCRLLMDGDIVAHGTAISAGESTLSGVFITLQSAAGSSSSGICSLSLPQVLHLVALSQCHSGSYAKLFISVWTTNRVRVQNALVQAALNGPFWAVEYDSENQTVRALHTNVVPASAVANEIQGTLFDAARLNRRSNVRERSDWFFELVLRFDQEVILETFEDRVSNSPIVLPRLPEFGLQQVSLEFLSTDAVHPPQQNPSSGTHAILRFKANTSPI